MTVPPALVGAPEVRAVSVDGRTSVERLSPGVRIVAETAPPGADDGGVDAATVAVVRDDAGAPPLTVQPGGCSVSQRAPDPTAVWVLSLIGALRIGVRRRRG